VAALNGVRGKILLDSGSVINAVSLNYVRNRLQVVHKALDEEEKRNFRAANGTAINIVGKVELNLNVQGLNIPVTFFLWWHR
jgi:hypothetical protein